jgi:hypothetical protein
VVDGYSVARASARPLQNGPNMNTAGRLVIIATDYCLHSRPRPFRRVAAYTFRTYNFSERQLGSHR